MRIVVLQEQQSKYRDAIAEAQNAQQQMNAEKTEAMKARELKQEMNSY